MIVAVDVVELDVSVTLGNADDCGICPSFKPRAVKFSCRCAEGQHLGTQEAEISDEAVWMKRLGNTPSPSST